MDHACRRNGRRQARPLPLRVVLPIHLEPAVYHVLRDVAVRSETAEPGVARLDRRRAPELAQQTLIADERTQHVEREPDLDRADRLYPRARRRLSEDLERQVDQRMPVRPLPSPLLAIRDRQEGDDGRRAALGALDRAPGGSPVGVTPSRLTASMRTSRFHTSVALQLRHVTCTCASIRRRSVRFLGAPTKSQAFRRNAQTSEDRLPISAAAANSSWGSMVGMARLLRRLS